MKFTSELIKKAHELTKEIREEFKEVDYKTQFGICISYLLKKGDKKMNVEETIKEAIQVIADTHGETEVTVKINSWKEKRIYVNAYCFKEKFDCFIDLSDNTVKYYNSFLAGAWKRNIRETLISKTKEFNKEIIKKYN